MKVVDYRLAAKLKKFVGKHFDRVVHPGYHTSTGVLMRGQHPMLLGKCRHEIRHVLRPTKWNDNSRLYLVERQAVAWHTDFDEHTGDSLHHMITMVLDVKTWEIKGFEFETELIQ